MKPGKVCPSCWRDYPCAIHTRPANAPWSDRDKNQHARWARAAKNAHPYCTHCGSTKKLDVHHDPHGNPIVLCNNCHCLTDPHARRR